MESRDYRICSVCGVEYNALSPKSHECEEQDIEWAERMDAQIAERKWTRKDTSITKVVIA